MMNMTTTQLGTALKEAYDTSTKEVNRFANLINSIGWDGIYTTEDGSTCYEVENISLEVFSLNPFDTVPAPSIWCLTDNSVYCF